MLKNKRLRNILLPFLLLLLAGVIGTFLWNSRKGVTDGEEVVVVKDNVITLTSDTEEDEQPIEVTEDKLIFNKPVPYKKGDVIVSGIIDTAPNGFIRKVVSISQKGEECVVETENGVLTDVFEELHITRTFALTENGLNADEINIIGNAEATLVNTVALKQDSMSNYRYATLATTKNKHSEDDDLDTDYQFTLPFDFDITDEISAEGEVGFSIWLEIKLDIQKGDVIFGIVAHNNSGGTLFVGCSAEEKREFEAEIFSKILPNFQFAIGPVPIVVTNEIQAVIEGETYIEGTIGTSIELKSENSSGFLYTSKSNKIEEINEKKYLSDGLKWETEANVSGGCSAGVSLHLISKLYGSTGADISVAIVGEIEGEVSVGLTDSSNGLEYVGSVDMSIGPKVQGSVVVSIPIVDKQLADKPIFEVDLPVFWEEHWESSSDWETELQQLRTIELNNTYVTRLRTVDMVEAPEFEFDYSDNWKITTEELHPISSINEQVVLTNERGTTITYMDYSGKLGAYSRVMMNKVEISKVADSSFAPKNYVTNPNHTDYTNYGKYIVAKIKIIAGLSMDSDTEYREVDGGYYYAVVPEEYVGVHDGIRGVSGIYELCSFKYHSYYTIISSAPSGGFTEQEEREVIAILTSFRE